MALSVDGQCSSFATSVVTASGGGWNEEAWAMAVCTCLNFTVLMTARNAAMPTSITTIRLLMKTLPLGTRGRFRENCRA